MIKLTTKTLRHKALRSIAQNVLCLCAFVVALLTSACSSTDTLADGQGQVSESLGDVYMTVSIGAPTMTRANTYRDEHDDVNNATLCIFKAETDAATDDADVALSSMTFHRAYTLAGAKADFQSGGGADDRNTQWYRRVIRIDEFKPTATTRYYAYVIANFNDNIEFVDGGKGMVMKQLKATKGSDRELLSQSTTFYEFSRFVITPPLGTVMTPAPMAVSLPPYSATNPARILYLPRITTTNLAYSEEDALSETKTPAVRVYLERLATRMSAVKSASLSGKLTDSKYDVYYSIDGTDHDKANSIRWSPDQRNELSFNVRQLTGATGTGGYLGMQATDKSAYRFVDTTPTGTDVANNRQLYRVFWAEDVNYHYATPATDKGGAATDTYGDETTKTAVAPQAGPQVEQLVQSGLWNGDYNYNFDRTLGEDQIESKAENTMDENSMMQEMTTRLYFRVPIAVGKKGGSPVTLHSFYTIPAEEPDLIYHADDTQATDIDGSFNSFRAEVWKRLTTMTAYTKWKADNGLTADDKDILCLNILNEEGLRKHTDGKIYAQLDGMLTSGTTIDSKDNWWEVDAACDLNQDGITGADETLTWPPFGAVWFKVLYNKDKVNTTALQESFRALNLTGRLNEAVQANYYIKGFAYYVLRLRHFDDTEVSDFTRKQNSSNYDAVYPAANRKADFLGRYGMVRNTWYKVELEEIRHIGSPTGIATDNNHQNITDDVDDQYIGARINIVSWGKREQDEYLE